MDKQNLFSTLSSLILKVKDFDEKNTFFLPNQDSDWLNYVVNKRNKKSNKKVLAIGGILYSCFLAAKGYDVTVVERSPLAAISQLYVAWLLNNNFSIVDVQKYLLLHLFKDRYQPHQRKNIFIPPDDYSHAIKKFMEFVNLNQTKSEELFDKIFKIAQDKGNKTISLILKGVDILGFEGYKFSLPTNIVIDDVQNFVNQTKDSFGLVLTNNVIDFFTTKESFFFAMSKLLSNLGILEITLYSQTSQSEIREMFNISQTNHVVGRTQLLSEVSPNLYIESLTKLILNNNIFLLSQKNIANTIEKRTPYWIKEMLDKGRLEKKYELFNNSSLYFTVINGQLNEVTK